ncbi:MAG TPA: hypothetical protein VGO31_00355 [Microbacteriaceae bacterium]|jgi:hypothetical protein|nr:hypothetical protein [Microbacteriaceae bacterium]
MGDKKLTQTAVAATADLAKRTASVAPALHLALASWALDRVVPDRLCAPWPEVRGHLERVENHRALDAPLRALTRVLATPAADSAELARELLTQAPPSPGLDDAPALLWLLSMAIEYLGSRLPQGDSGLAALIERRADLASRLAEELDEQAFEDPEIADLGDQGEFDLRPIIYVSPLDALLIDLALASSDPVMSWLRFEEAEAVFGRRERGARSLFARRLGALLWLCGLLAAGLGVASLGWAGANRDLLLPVAALALALFGTAATRVLESARHQRRTVAAGLLTITAAVVAAVMIINNALRHPLLPDLSGFAAGALVGAAATYAHVVLFPDQVARGSDAGEGDQAQPQAKQ